MIPATVVYATDANYWPHFYVSLYSLLKNNRNRPWRIFIVCDDALHNDCQVRAGDLGRFGNIEQLSLVGTSDLREVLEDARVDNRFGITTYYKLLFDRIVPPDTDRILYLDSDTVIVDSLEPLLSADLHDRTLAAYAKPLTPKISAYNRHIGVPDGSRGFNAGVLLIDMRRWRLVDAERRLIERLRRHKDKSLFADQDILSGVFYDDWTPISHVFNCQGKDREKVPGAVVMHYAGKRKPWDFAIPHSRQTAYWRYRSETLYAISPFWLIWSEIRARLWSYMFSAVASASRIAAAARLRPRR